jgi:hypothetical protein
MMGLTLKNIEQGVNIEGRFQYAFSKSVSNFKEANEDYNCKKKWQAFERP